MELIVERNDPPTIIRCVILTPHVSFYPAFVIFKPTSPVKLWYLENLQVKILFLTILLSVVCVKCQFLDKYVKNCVSSLRSKEQTETEYTNRVSDLQGKTLQFQIFHVKSQVWFSAVIWTSPEWGRRGGGGQRTWISTVVSRNVARDNLLPL